MTIAQRSLCNSIVVLAALSALVSCNRDPNVAKRRYLESGNKYFDKGNYKSAIIMYKDALQKDQLFGPAHYKLALTYLKIGQYVGAMQEFHKALERPPLDSPDHWDSMVKLSEIDLGFLAQTANAQLQNEVENFVKQMLAHDPNSFDGHRLNGDLRLTQALIAQGRAQKDQAIALLAQSAEEYRKADTVKPGQSAILMQLARVSRAQNDPANAEKLFRQVIANDKTVEAAYKELFGLEVFQGRNDDGEQTLKQAFQSNPKSYDFLVLLAQLYASEQRRADVERTLDQIKSHAKDYPQAYITVGSFYMRQGEGEAAIRTFRDGMAKDPKQKVVYQKQIIEVLLRQGKRAEAANLNAEILKANPEDTDARGLQATSLLANGDVNRALTELQSVATNAPKNPVAHYNLGRAYMSLQEYAQAQQQLERAVEIYPGYENARVALAELQLGRGDFEAAAKSAAVVLATDRKSVRGRLIQSAALIGEKKYVEARTLLEAMRAALPNAPDVYYQLALADMAESKFKEAEGNFRKTYELNPSDIRGLMGVANTYVMRNDPDAALALLQGESAKAPNRADLKSAAGNIALIAGRFDLAIQLYQSSLGNLDPAATKVRGETYLRIGETYRRKGDLGGAIEALKKAREIEPDNVLTLTTLAMVLEAASRWPDARTTYEAALKLDPQNVVTLNNEAMLIAEHGGDLEQALTMAQRATQLAPKQPEVRDTLGLIYLKKGLADGALDIFKQLVVEQPNAANYRYHLGMAYFKKGDKPHAKKELQDSLKYNPTPADKQQIEATLSKL